MDPILCMADHWGLGEAKDVIIEKDENEVLLIDNRRPVKIMYNGLQLRFEMEENDVYIVFDGRSKSNLTIKEMAEILMRNGVRVV